MEIVEIYEFLLIIMVVIMAVLNHFGINALSFFNFVLFKNPAEGDREISMILRTARSQARVGMTP